jgi:hypothetical protein
LWVAYLLARTAQLDGLAVRPEFAILTSSLQAHWW